MRNMNTKGYSALRDIFPFVIELDEHQVDHIVNTLLAYGTSFAVTADGWFRRRIWVSGVSLMNLNETDILAGTAVMKTKEKKEKKAT